MHGCLGSSESWQKDGHTDRHIQTEYGTLRHLQQILISLLSSFTDLDTESMLCMRCGLIRNLTVRINKWWIFDFSLHNNALTFILRASLRSGVLWWACLCEYVCLCVREHISEITRPIFTKFLYVLPVAVVRSCFIARRCDMLLLCTSGFMDDVTAAHDGQE